MKLLSESDVKRIIRAKDKEEIKKSLKIRKKDNYYEKILYNIEKFIYNYDEKYLEVIYKLLELLENDITVSKNYLDKCNKIISFRKRFSNIHDSIYKKTNKSGDNLNYSDLYDVMLFIEELDEKFDKEVSSSKISLKNDKGINKVLDYLEYLLKNVDENGTDIINRLLNAISSVELNKVKINIISKCDRINKIKSSVKESIERKEQFYQEEKKNIDSLKFLYQKLEKLEVHYSNFINNEITKYDNDFDSLLDYLSKIVDSFNERQASSAYKILDCLEKEVINNRLDFMSKCEKLLKIRKKAIEVIKNTKKSARNSSAKIYYLKEIANKLENLELNLAYNIKSSDVIVNYNIVKYIFFDLENITYTENLINQNPYLINAFSINSKHILTLVVDKYLKAIESKDKSDLYKKLGYYDNCLELLLTNRYVKIDERVKKECENIITKRHEKLLQSRRSNDFISSWYKHLIKKIDDPLYVEDFDDIDKMHNVSFDDNYSSLDINLIVKEDKSSGQSYIATIDEFTDVNKDDAISINKIYPDIYNLKVYISDPNAILSMSSSPIQSAREKGETIYLEDKTIPLFSPKMIHKHLSLDEGKIRNVKIYDFLIDNKGKLVDFKIDKGLVKVDKNFTYEEINKLLKHCNDENIYEYLENLSILKSILSRKDMDDKLLKKMGIEITKAEKLVATYMIYTNHKTAEYFAKKGLPFIYRHYDEKEISLDNSILDMIPLSERENYNNFLEELGKSSNGASYSSDNSKHDGLELKYYSHITSPNRRYADILANQCIDNMYFNNLSDEEIKTFEKYLKREIDYLNDRLEGIKHYYGEYAKYALKRK